MTSETGTHAGPPAAAHARAGADADAALREARRQRVFDAMVASRLDALVLGRRDSVAYATGARSLWTAGTRPFGAAAVLVAESRAVHLLSTWDEGVPPEVPFERLYGITWNPAVMARALGAVPGLAGARRIGVDGLSVGFAHAAGRLAPDAELVPADDLLHAVRVLKLPGEVQRIRLAAAVAAAGVGVAAAALAAGSARADALAAALGALAVAGVTVPSSAPVVEPVAAGGKTAGAGGGTSIPASAAAAQSAEAAAGQGAAAGVGAPSAGPGSGREPATGPVRAGGALVLVDLGVLVDGYEGARGRTVLAGRGPADGRVEAVRAAHRHLVEACRPSATASDLRAAAAEAGVTRWTVRGSGMGFEPPVVTDSLGAGAELAEGMVLSVEVDVDGVRRRDLAHVRADATEVL
jgi:Xaa-Pro dipeptidase